MGKAVLISVRPQWTPKILSGEKTIELRKTRPNLPTPFKTYIYQTLPKSGDWNERDGRVVCEFACDEIKRIDVPYPAYWHELDKSVIEFVIGGTCLSLTEIHNYLGHRTGYGWHISDLKIYEKPIPVTNFWKPDACPFVSEHGCIYPYHCFRAGQTKRCGNHIERPPQSWCYVEELT